MVSNFIRYSCTTAFIACATANGGLLNAPHPNAPRMTTSLPFFQAISSTFLIRFSCSACSSFWLMRTAVFPSLGFIPLLGHSRRFGAAQVNTLTEYHLSYSNSLGYAVSDLNAITPGV